MAFEIVTQPVGGKGSGVSVSYRRPNHQELPKLMITLGRQVTEALGLLPPSALAPDVPRDKVVVEHDPVAGKLRVRRAFQWDSGASQRAPRWKDRSATLAVNIPVKGGRREREYAKWKIEQTSNGHKQLIITLPTWAAPPIRVAIPLRESVAVS